MQGPPQLRLIDAARIQDSIVDLHPAPDEPVSRCMLNTTACIPPMPPFLLLLICIAGNWPTSLLVAAADTSAGAARQQHDHLLARLQRGVRGKDGQQGSRSTACASQGNCRGARDAGAEVGAEPKKLEGQPDSRTPQQSGLDAEEALTGALAAAECQSSRCWPPMACRTSDAMRCCC